MEIWLPVVGYEGRYDISSRGRVRSHKRSGRIAVDFADKDGYRRIELSAGGKQRKFLVHRLVARAFLGPADDATQVNHRNGVRADNRVGNLEWASLRENFDHAVRTGLTARGSRQHLAKLTDTAVREIRAATGRVNHVLAAKFGVTPTTIGNVRNGKTWRHVT